MITKETVYEALKSVIDPEVGFDIVNLGLIYDARVEGSHVEVDMTLSTRGCPLHELLKQWAQEAVLKIDGIKSSNVNIVWEPEWNITMASDEVKEALS
ncbi:MAG: metal-sulfur cluster assembly factor [Sulfurospirillaceae bacterium]|jgi:metal-sulfur cluster biosynthetic enzyme|nr:metal-sulfur cluster assembly factor [Sulfurospirillaceae bacterium]MCK9545569.1 metal-sulfur cluster assembly factor [Sulfurospirillaceae bacterium]MDY0238902.1 metal-sulfur cluster assembly factor [Campylobacterales bacterium]